MSNAKPKSPRKGTDTDSSAEFLTAEHKYFAESFWRNEETGEKRVNFFITLVAAVIAALAALVTKGGQLLKGQDVYGIAIYGLLALLAFGVITLLRMIQRNRVTDEYKSAMDAIRDYCKKQDPGLKVYKPFGTQEGGKVKRRKLGTGGLAETVALVNSLILAALVYLWVSAGQQQVPAIYALGGFVVALVAQLIFVSVRQQRS